MYSTHPSRPIMMIVDLFWRYSTGDPVVQVGLSLSQRQHAQCLAKRVVVYLRAIAMISRP